MFNLDGDGLIDANEIKQVMNILREEVTDEDEEVLGTMKESDVDGDGFNNCVENKTIYLGNRREKMLLHLCL